MSELDLELFDPSQDVSIDGMQLVDIPIDDISDEAAQEAALLIENLSKFYYDEDFMRRNPAFKKRVDTDLESLRILFKMRRADEEAHWIALLAAFWCYLPIWLLHALLCFIEKRRKSLAKS